MDMDTQVSHSFSFCFRILANPALLSQNIHTVVHVLNSENYDLFTSTILQENLYFMKN